MAFGLLAALSAPLTLQAAVVYKWTDADGVVHFSDQPVPGAEKIVTATGASRGIMGQAAANVPTGKPLAKISALGATRLTITSPAQDETFTGNQPVSVHLAAEPALKSDQAITWTLNGAQVSQPSDATEFTLSDLPRGSYTLAATVVDSASGESKSAESVTFNVMRPGLLSPQHK
jgi:Domain of unknown function (DUF4124)